MRLDTIVQETAGNFAKKTGEKAVEILETLGPKKCEEEETSDNKTLVAQVCFAFAISFAACLAILCCLGCDRSLGHKTIFDRIDSTNSSALLCLYASVRVFSRYYFLTPDGRKLSRKEYVNLRRQYKNRINNNVTDVTYNPLNSTVSFVNSTQNPNREVFV